MTVHASHLLPAVKCAFPLVSLVFCEAQPAHPSMPADRDVRLIDKKKETCYRLINHALTKCGMSKMSWCPALQWFRLFLLFIPQVEK